MQTSHYDIMQSLFLNYFILTQLPLFARLCEDGVWGVRKVLFYLSVSRLFWVTRFTIKKLNFCNKSLFSKENIHNWFNDCEISMFLFFNTFSNVCEWLMCGGNLVAFRKIFQIFSAVFGALFFRNIYCTQQINVYFYFFLGMCRNVYCSVRELFTSSKI